MPDGTMSRICGNMQILFDYRRQMKQNSGNNYAQISEILDSNIFNKMNYISI